MFRKPLVVFLTIVMVCSGLTQVLASQDNDGVTVTQANSVPEENEWSPVIDDDTYMSIKDMEGSTRGHAETPAEMLVPSGRAGPDVAPRNITFNDTNPTWFGFSVGTVGMTTEIDFIITNIGDTNATDVTVKIEIRDFFDNLMDFDETIVADIPPGVDLPMTWDSWTPSHSAKIHAVVRTDMVGDVDTSNNNMSFYGSGSGWWVNKWLDYANDDTGWSGDLTASEWHITDSVQTDPAPSDHSSPEVWYAGTEQPIVGDFYTANMNSSLISPTVDLKRMNPYYPAYLNFKYYGATMLGDGISMTVSIDNGATWIDTRTFITGLTLVNGQPDWVVRVDNWIDEDNDGTREAGEFDWGIDISEYIGHNIKFKFTFTSGPTSTGLGFYLDDLIVYGFEAENEVALVRIENMGTTHVDETEDVTATFWNVGAGASPTFDVRMTVYEGSTEQFHEDTTLGPIPAGGTGQATWSFTPNETGDLKIEVELLSPPAGTDSSIFNNRQTRRVHVSSGAAGVLLVDDDCGKTNSGRLPYGNYEVDTDYMLVSAIDRELDVYHVLYDETGPDASVLSGYHTVIWSTGWDGTGRTAMGTLTADDRASLRSYMDGGGSFWLISQEAVFDLMDAAPQFLSNYLHVSDFGDDAGTPGIIDGVGGNEITDGMSMAAVVRVPANDRADSITPDGASVGITYQDETVQNPSTGPFNGISHNGSYKMVYTSFEHSAFVNDGDRAMFANAVLDWLYAGLSMRIIEPRKSVDAGGTANYTVRIRNHGIVNKTVRDLSVTSIAAGWSAEIAPHVSSGVPETGLEGFTTLNAYLHVEAPQGNPAGTEGRVAVTMVVDETGETFENATYTTVLETVRMNMTVSPKDQVGEVGKNASYLITLRNVGNVRTTVNMSINGTIDTWTSLDPAFLVLDQDETDGVILTIMVPKDAEAGNYTLDVMAEGRFRNIIELSVDTVNVTVGQFHALSISSLRAPNGGQVDPSELTVDIVVEIDNNGNGPDRVDISLSGTFPDEENWVWGTRQVQIPAFEKGFRTNVTIGVWDEALGGEYNMTVRVDSEDGKTFTESYLLITVLRPDLYLTQNGITFDYDLVVGEEISFKVKVFNGGEVDSPEANITIYDRSMEKIFSGTTISGIKAGSFTEVTVKWIPPYRGPEELEFHVNEKEAIVEMGYENNSVRRLVIVYQPNLAVGVTELQFFVNGKDKDILRVGDEVSITVQIKNMDDHSYKADDVVVEFYLDGTMIGNRTTDIKDNNIAFVKVEWKATKGTHSFVVKVDPLDTIDEAKEDDNEVTRDIRVSERKEGGLEFDPLWIGAIIGIAIIIGVIYAMARGAIPSPFKQSRVEIADKSYKCNECGKKIKKGREYYHCACGARAHIKCAKKAELCECLKRVRIEE